MKKIDVYQIESNVEIPKDTSVPLSALEAGDSMLFPLEKRASVQTSASILKRTQGKTFKVKRVSEDRGRVWRVT